MVMSPSAVSAYSSTESQVQIKWVSPYATNHETSSATTSRSNRERTRRLTIVDPSDGRPELLLLQLGYGVNRLFPRIRLVPFILCQDRDRMRRILEQVVILGLIALDDLFGLASDRDHGIAESVDLFLGFRLGGLDEHSRRDGPRDGRSCGFGWHILANETE